MSHQTQELKLWYPTQVNLYDLFNEEMTDQLKHQANDDTYPEALHEALSKQRSKNSDSDDSVGDSDTLSSSHPKPIRNRGSNVISLF